MSSIRRRARKSDIDRQLSNWSKRRIASWALFVTAAIVLVQHWLAHMGFQPLGKNMGWQDLLIGYPTGGLLAIVGLVIMDPNPRI